MVQYAAGQRVTAAALDGSYTTYTPTWSSTGTQPAIGNGTITGWYTLSGGLVFFGIYMVGGSTTTAGTLLYSLSIPTTAKTTTSGYPVGSYTGILDHTGVAPGTISGTVFSGASSLGSGGGGIGYMAAQTSTSGIDQWSATQPFAPAGASFTLVISGFYLSS